MIHSAEQIGKLTPQALTELMRMHPSHRLHHLGSIALDDMAQAQTESYGIDSVLARRREFNQAYDGYWQAEVLGFRE